MIKFSEIPIGRLFKDKDSYFVKLNKNEGEFNAIYVNTAIMASFEADYKVLPIDAELILQKVE